MLQQTHGEFSSRKSTAEPSTSVYPGRLDSPVLENCGSLAGQWKTAVEKERQKSMEEKKRILYHLHIPKAAGTSFHIDIKRIVGESKWTIDSHEGCFGDSPHARAGVVTMLRHPRDHVLSQYTFCATSTDKGTQILKKWRTMPSTFGAWIQAWSRLRKEGRARRDFSRVGPTLHNTPWCSYLPFKCYSPLNLQSQRFTCEAASKYPDKLDVDRAVTNMHASFFIGIVEAYPESMCLFRAKTTNKVPASCNCNLAKNKSKKQKGHHAGHGSAKHSVQNVPREVLQDVDSFTEGDQELYRAAVHRFINETREVEVRHGVKILCSMTEMKLMGLTASSATPTPTMAVSSPTPAPAPTSSIPDTTNSTTLISSGYMHKSATLAILLCWSVV